MYVRCASSLNTTLILVLPPLQHARLSNISAISKMRSTAAMANAGWWLPVLLSFFIFGKAVQRCTGYGQHGVE